MRNFPRLLFVLLLVLSPAVMWATSGALPDPVATHFRADGFANGWMTRDGYRLFMLALGTLVPVFIVVMVGLAPQFTNRMTKVPHPEYWLAPARRAETMSRMLSHACWLGCVMLLFFTAMHLLMLRANAVTPPRLPEGPFFTMVVTFVVVVIVWVFALRARFRDPA